MFCELLASRSITRRHRRGNFPTFREQEDIGPDPNFDPTKTSSHLCLTYQSPLSCLHISKPKPNKYASITSIIQTLAPIPDHTSYAQYTNPARFLLHLTFVSIQLYFKKKKVYRYNFAGKKFPTKL